MIQNLVNELTEKIEDALLDCEGAWYLRYQIRATIEQVLTERLKILHADFYFSSEAANVESFEAYAKSKLASSMAHHLTEVMHIEDVAERDYYATKKATLVILDMKENGGFNEERKV